MVISGIGKLHRSYFVQESVWAKNWAEFSKSMDLHVLFQVKGTQFSLGKTAKLCNMISRLCSWKSVLCVCSGCGTCIACPVSYI